MIPGPRGEPAAAAAHGADRCGGHRRELRSLLQNRAVAERPGDGTQKKGSKNVCGFICIYMYLYVFICIYMYLCLKYMYLYVFMFKIYVFYMYLFDSICIYI